MEADVVTDPDTVVVELISTSIASLTVLCVGEYMRVAQIAVETILIWVEFYQGHLIFLCGACKAFQGYGGVRRITRSCLHCGYDHREEADEVERRHYVAECLVYCSGAVKRLFYHKQAYHTKEEAYEDEGSYDPRQDLEEAEGEIEAIPAYPPLHDHHFIFLYLFF